MHALCQVWAADLTESKTSSGSDGTKKFASSIFSISPLSTLTGSANPVRFAGLRPVRWGVKSGFDFFVPFFNIFHIHVITDLRTFCVQPGTACPAYAGGCGIVGIRISGQ